MGKHTIFFNNKPQIFSTASIAGTKECEGIIGSYVSRRLDDDMFGESTYEKAECKMLTYVIDKAIAKSKLKKDDVDMIVSGDLLNQIISSSFTARDFNIPFIGVYGACSTMSEALAISACLIDGGYVDNIVAGTVSHFATAERQYRFPLELGTTRPPQAQWTVTGAGATLITSNNHINRVERGAEGIGSNDDKVTTSGREKSFEDESLENREVLKTRRKVKITTATFGKVVDFGVTDVNNMGAAMAPAAADTILMHFQETQRPIDYYDMIVTGDLGALGSRLLKDLMWEKGYDISKQHIDCGEIIYKVIEDEFQGGSGAGCSACVFNSYIYKKMINEGIDRVLFCATGALLSTISSGQGESIPCICHAVSLEV